MSVKRLVRSFLSAAALIGVGAGVPWLLVTVAGWPLPQTWPEWSQVWLDVRQLNINPVWVFGGLAIAGWLLWAQFVWSAVFEALNVGRARRGVVALRAPFAVPGVQLVAAKLVAGVLSVSLLTSSPAAAVSLDALGSVVSVTAPAVAAPSQSGVVESMAVATVVVADNETAWDLAERVFGDSERVGELLAHNNLSALDIKAGLVLDLPPGVGAPAGEVTVVKDDHLWGISEQRLVDAGVNDPSNAQIAAHVEMMVEANQAEIEDPDLIYPAEVFETPAIGDVGVDDGLPPHPNGSLAEEQRNLTHSSATTPDAEKAGSLESSGAATAEPANVESASAAAASESDDALDVDLDDGESGWLSRDLLIGGGAVAAAVTGFLLLNRRRQRGRGTKGLVWQPTSDEVAMVTASSLTLMDWVAAELGELVSALPTPASFAPVAIQWSNEALEVLWDETATVVPVLDWEASDSAAWILRYDDDADVRALTPAPPVPGLVTLGDRDSGAHVAVDLEALGSLAVTGDQAMVESALRSFMVEMGAGTALSNASVLTVGFTTESASTLPRVRAVEIDSALREAHAVASQVRTASGSRHGSFGLRARGSGDEAVVVIVASSDVVGVDELIRIAQPWSGVAVIVAGANDNTKAAFDLRTGVGRLESPYFVQPLEVTPVQVSHATDSRVAVVVDHAMQEPAAVDDSDVIAAAEQLSRTSVPPPQFAAVHGGPASMHGPATALAERPQPTTPAGVSHLVTDIEPPTGPIGVIQLPPEPPGEPPLGEPPPGDPIDAAWLLAPTDFDDPDAVGDEHTIADDLEQAKAETLLPSLTPEPTADPDPGPDGQVVQTPASSDPEILDDLDDAVDDELTEDSLVPAPPGALVRVMGDVACDDHGDLSGIALRIVVALACAGERGLSTEMLVDQVWGGRLVKPRTVTNQVGNVRRIIGTSGLPRRPANSPAVINGYMLDVDWLKYLVVEGAQRSSQLEARCLEAGLSLVSGPPFASSGLDWPDLVLRREDAQVVIEGAALRLVELALEMEDFELAKFAVRQGVVALHLNETMARARMRIAAAEQDATSVVRVYRQLEEELLRVFDHDEPSSETQRLRDDLLASLGATKQRTEP